MAGYSMGTIFLGILFWAAAIALGAPSAGLILIWFHDRLRGAGQGEVHQLTVRLDRPESRLAVYLQQTGGYQEWAALQEREREIYRER
ncbi:MAG TPA: hypothetical protein VIL85_20320 [Thermomicrobiales bacterium]|jgi:hypothetical protein